MDEKVVLQEFKKLQPYKDRVIRDPFGNEIIDVESINKRPFDYIIRALKEVKEHENSSIFVLQGEPGSGKSHLLARIYRNAEKERFLFALYNPLIVRLTSVYSSLLKSLFESLERTHSELKAKPLNHLRGHIIKIGLMNYKKSEYSKDKVIIEGIINPKKEKLPYVYYEQFESLKKDVKEQLRAFISEEVLSYVRRESNHSLGKQFLKAIFKALLDDEDYEILREFILEGNLNESDAKKINIETGLVINEDIAQEILRSIFILSPFPILLSIDQIEHLDNQLQQDEIIKFLSDLDSLISNSKKVLLLLSAQTQVFRKWASFLPEHLKARFSNVATLDPLTHDEALEIIKKRNIYFLNKLGIPTDTITNPFFPFDKETLLKEITAHKLRSPRKLLEFMDAKLEGRTIKPKSVEEEFEKIVEKTTYRKDDMEDQLAELLRILFKGEKIYPRSKKLIIQALDTVFGIDNSKGTYFSTVRKLVSSLKKRGVKKAILVRDKNFPIGPQTKSKKLIDMYNIGLRYYSPVEGKEIIALLKLYSLTESKDIELDLEEVEKFAREKVLNFIKLENVNEPKKRSLEEKAEEIVSKILKEFSDGKSAITRINKFVDLTDYELVQEVVKRLRSSSSLRVEQMSDGNYFIHKTKL